MTMTDFHVKFDSATHNFTIYNRFFVSKHHIQRLNTIACNEYSDMCVHTNNDRMLHAITNKKSYVFFFVGFGLYLTFERESEKSVIKRRIKEPMQNWFDFLNVLKCGDNNRRRKVCEARSHFCYANEYHLGNL